jgi:hypothetical protein
VSAHTTANNKFILFSLLLSLLIYGENGFSSFLSFSLDGAFY